MDAIHSAIEATARTIYGPASSHEETEPETQVNKPTERGEANATPPAAENQLPTLGPGRVVYMNKPIVTTTSETSKLTNESPNFQNLSLRSSSPPPKGTATTGHRRVDSGIGEAEVNTAETSKSGAEPGAAKSGAEPGAAESGAESGAAESSAEPGAAESGAYQRFGHEGVGDDGAQQTAREIDDKSLTTEGHPRPVFVGHEVNEDGIRRDDGRDRVQFNDSIGSTGSLKPSGAPNPERPRQGSAGELPYNMNPERRGSLPTGARIGTVQGGTVRGRQQELEAAQTAQSGGLGGVPTVFGTGSHDPTGITQVQKENHSWSKPDMRRSSIPGQGEGAHAEQILTQEEQGKCPQEDRHVQREPGDVSQGPRGVGDPRPDTDTVQKPHPTIQASPASSTQRSDEHPPSPNEPHSQGDTTNTAIPNATPAMEPGSNKSTYSPTESSVGAGPAHAQHETQKHQGRDHPTEEQKGDALKPCQDRRGSQETQEGEKKEETGHLWIKSTGTAADGGDFDAAKPGAGREADRLLEEAGVHRDTKNVKGDQHNTTTTTSKNPANPTHHSGSATGSGKHGGFHLPGILHHHDAKKETTTPEGGSGHKGGLSEKLEKIKEKVKLRKD